MSASQQLQGVFEYFWYQNKQNSCEINIHISRPAVNGRVDGTHDKQIFILVWGNVSLFVFMHEKPKEPRTSHCLVHRNRFFCRVTKVLERL